MRNLVRNIHLVAVISAAAFGTAITDLAAQEQPAELQPPTAEQAPAASRPTETPSPRTPPAFDFEQFFRSSPFRGLFQTRTLAQTPTRRRSRSRLTTAPPVFGDLLGPGTELNFAFPFFAVVNPMNPPVPIGQQQLSAEIPIASGTSSVRIADNNKAVTLDRVYVLHNHFHGARDTRFQTAAQFGPFPLPESQRSSSIDRLTFGLEKTFADDDWSVELRMPFVNGFRETSDPFGNFSMESGSIGNLAVILKNQVYRNDDVAIAAGIGTSLPTGSDVEVEYPFLQTRMTIENRSVHLQPFLGLLTSPTDRWFVHAFAQLDLVANGNPVHVNSPMFNVSEKLTEQNLLMLDLATGYWMFRHTAALDDGRHADVLPRPRATRLTGIAPIMELHYASTLQDADSFITPGGLIGNATNRMDVLHLTLGLHAEFGLDTMIRIGTALPIRGRTDRLFDSELILSVIRRL